MVHTVFSYLRLGFKVAFEGETPWCQPFLAGVFISCLIQKKAATTNTIIATTPRFAAPGDDPIVLVLASTRELDFGYSKKLLNLVHHRRLKILACMVGSQKDLKFVILRKVGGEGSHTLCMMRLSGCWIWDLNLRSEKSFHRSAL